MRLRSRLRKQLPTLRCRRYSKLAHEYSTLNLRRAARVDIMYMQYVCTSWSAGHIVHDGEAGARTPLIAACPTVHLCDQGS